MALIRHWALHSSPTLHIWVPYLVFTRAEVLNLTWLFFITTHLTKYEPNSPVQTRSTQLSCIIKARRRNLLREIESFKSETSFGTMAQTCKSKRIWIRFLLEKITFLIFSFPLSANKTNVMLIRYSTRNASKIRWKLGNGSVLMRTEYLNTRFPGFLRLP